MATADANEYMPIEQSERKQHEAMSIPAIERVSEIEVNEINDIREPDFYESSSSKTLDGDQGMSEEISAHHVKLDEANFNIEDSTDGFGLDILFAEEGYITRTNACIIILHLEAAFEEFAMEGIEELHSKISKHVQQHSCTSCKVLLVNGTPQASCIECNQWVDQIRNFSSDGNLHWDVVSLQSVKRKPRKLGQLFYPDYFKCYRRHRQFDELLTVVSQCTFYQRRTNKDLMQQVANIRKKVFQLISTSSTDKDISMVDIEKIISLLEWQEEHCTKTPSIVRCREAVDQIKQIADKASLPESEDRMIFVQHVEGISRRLDAYEMQVVDHLAPDQQYENMKMETQKIEATCQMLKAFLDFHRIDEHDLRNELDTISVRSKKINNKIVKVLSKRQTGRLIPSIAAALEKIVGARDDRKRFRNNSYLNWLKATVVLQYTKDGVADYSLDVVGKWHTSIKTAAETERGSETECYVCSIEVKPTPKLKSNCKDCYTWFTRIFLPKNGARKLQLHCKKIFLKDVKRSPWKLACLYLPIHCWDHNGPHEADIYALLKLMLNCDQFKDCISVAFASQVLETRNNVFHSSTMEMKDGQLTDFIETVLNLLNSNTDLKNKHKCREAVTRIQKIRIGTDVPDEGDERRVLSEQMAEMKQRLEAAEHLKSIPTSDDEKREIRIEFMQIQEPSLENDLKDIDDRSSKAIKDMSYLADSVGQSVSEREQVLERRMKEVEAALEDQIRRLDQVQAELASERRIFQRTEEEYQEEIMRLRDGLKEKDRKYDQLECWKDELWKARQGCRCSDDVRIWNLRLGWR